jgi:L-cystine uptake protein TcyP (sodium:dicarboxylate symporter family)
VSSTTRESIRAAEAVAGLLAAAALFLGLMELAYRPFRLAPAAVVLLMAATVMSRDQQRLIKLGFAAVGICFVAGATLQIVTHHPLY